MFTNLWPGDLDSVRNGGFLWPGIGGSWFGMVQPFLGFEFSTTKRGTDNVRLRVGEDAGRRWLSWGGRSMDISIYFKVKLILSWLQRPFFWNAVGWRSQKQFTSAELRWFTCSAVIAWDSTDLCPTGDVFCLPCCGWAMWRPGAISLWKSRSSARQAYRRCCDSTAYVQEKGTGFIKGNAKPICLCSCSMLFHVVPSSTCQRHSAASFSSFCQVCWHDSWIIISGIYYQPPTTSYNLLLYILGTSSESESGS